MVTKRHFTRIGFLGAAGLLLPLGASPLSGQTFQGRVLDESNNAPVVTALVRLIDTDGVQRAITAADSVGFFRVVAPEPGIYRLEAARLGYEGMVTPPLEARNPERAYPVDLVLRRAPIPIRGLDISITNQEADRQVRRMIGMNPSSLRKEPIRYQEIQANLEQGQDLSGLLRWSNTASLLVFRTIDGPCYTLRSSGCLPVYFNGMHYRQEVLDVVPLDMIHTVVLLYPNESIIYPRGAVLLYSEAWLR